MSTPPHTLSSPAGNGPRPAAAKPARAAGVAADSWSAAFVDTLDRRPGLWAAGLIFLSFAVRLWFIASGQLDLVQDEAQYWDWSRHIQLSYYSKGPLVAWIIGFWAWILGPTELAVRMGALLHATLAQILLWFGVARLMNRPRWAVLCLMVANTMPLFLASGVLMTTDNILMVCWLGALLCLYALTCPPPGQTPPLATALPLLALCMALGNLGKYMMLAMMGVAVLHFWLLHRQRLLPPGVALKSLVAMALGTALGYTPILLWNMQNGWVGFLHVGTLAGVTGAGATRLVRWDTMPEFLASQFGVATPWWMLFMLFAGWRAWRLARTIEQNRAARPGEVGPKPTEKVSPMNMAPERTAALPGDAAAETMAEAAERAQRVCTASLLTCAFWPLLGGMLLWSLHTRVYANWAGMSYVAGIMLAAEGLERALTRGQNPSCFCLTRAAQNRKPEISPDRQNETEKVCRRSRNMALLWLGLGVLTSTLVFAQNLLPLPPHLNPAARLKGWADLGRELGELAQELPNPDRVFYFGDTYDVTAELAFYAPGQPVAYCADFGRRRAQYDLWPDPTGHVVDHRTGRLVAVAPQDDKIGWDAFYVSARGHTPEQLHDMFDEVTVLPYASTHRGKPGRTFTIVRLRNFNGHWPHSSHARY